MRLAALLPAVVLVAGLGACGGDESEVGVTIAGGRDPAGSGWRPIAEGPLVPRHDAAGAWTGRELVVVGGRTGRPCPPGARCALPAASRDAAAYDPAADTWRALPPSPVPVAGAEAAVVDGVVVVVAGDRAVALDPDGGSWRRLDDPPNPSSDPQLVVTPDGLVVTSYDQPRRSGAAVDVRLDLASGRWEPLPHDPFGESYDRSMAWDGERLWLLSMAVEDHLDAFEGAPSRVAVLDGGRWRVVDDATPPLTYGQRWWWDGARLVVPPARFGHPGRAFDPASRTWQELPATGACGSCDRWEVAAGAGPDWVSGPAGFLATSAPPATAAVRPLDALPAPDVLVWAGDRLLAWGGPDPDYRANSAAGYLLAGIPEG